MDVTGGAAGIAGWVGTGLLGSVLYWLLYKHLPEKDRQLKEFAEARDSQLRDFASSHNQHLKSMIEQARHDFTEALTQSRHDFRDNIERILTFNERQMLSLTNVIHKDMEQMASMVAALNRTVENLGHKIERRTRDEPHDQERRHGQESR